LRVGGGVFCVGGGGGGGVLRELCEGRGESVQDFVI